MHGVKREHDANKLALKISKDALKIEEYRGLLLESVAVRKALWECRQGNDESSIHSICVNALKITANILALNSSHYTMWNMRKEVLVVLMHGTPLDSYLLEEERKLTMKCLQANPKSYCIWEHRKWCLERAGITQEMRAKELGLCEKLHAMDSRNFHCWNYRRWLIGVKDFVAQDVEYTRQRINEDFSNYSAWHARSVAIANGPVPDSEWDLIMNAMYTGPQDQSVWMYVYWLLGKSGNKADTIVRLAGACVELLGLDGEAQSKWALLTLVRLLKTEHATVVSLPSSHPSKESLIDALARIDPMRKQYYRSL